MVNGLHIYVWDKTIKPFATVLSGVGGVEGGDGGGDLTYVQYKAIWNYHSESPLYNEYMPIKWKRYQVQ
jgi:hypothetical protein